MPLFGKRRSVHAVALCLCSFWIVDSPSFGQDVYAPLESFVQSSGFVPHIPLSDTIHAGGLAKLCGKDKSYDFLQLPPNAKVADTLPAAFAWPAANGARQVKVSLLLSAISSLIDGVGINTSLSANKTTALKEIDASGITLKYDYVSMLNQDLELRNQVRTYESKSCRMFIVTEVVTSNALSFTTSSDLGATISINNSASNDTKCTAPPAQDSSKVSPTSAPATTPPATTPPATTPPATTPPATTPPATNAAKPKTSTTPATTVAKAVPSAQLAACMSKSNQITLNSPTALTFAVKLEALNYPFPPEPVTTAANVPPVPPVGIPSPVPVVTKNRRITGKTTGNLVAEDASMKSSNVLHKQIDRANANTFSNK